jgi:hypothetical protein
MTDPHSRGKGAANPVAKLTNNQVKMLREYRKGGWSHNDLALLFHISPSRSCEICRGKAYADAPGPIEKQRNLYFQTVNGMSPNAKVTPQIAEFIRKTYSEGGWTHGDIQGKIHDTFGVEISKSLVGLVLRRKTRV